jgi:predicted adenine nucleotide alpha hydrolase (AANH) superfamily ATPase
MKILMHVCCAPCFCAPLEELRGEGIEVTGHFYNPNVHPLLEFRKRLKAVKVMQAVLGMDMIWDERYGLTDFLKATFDRPEPRCELCWGMRMTETARLAKERGFDAFSTTLLISGHQDHEAVKRIAENAAERFAVDFFYRDFRPLQGRSREMAKRLMLYRQQYCGCIFSEYERYKDTARELFRGETSEERKRHAE